MKSLPHHIKKLNRKVIRSAQREEAQGNEEVELYKIASPPVQRSKEETRKLAKRAMKAEALHRTPLHDSEEERNWKMKHRVPIFDRNNAAPRKTKPTQKKTPRL